MGFEGEEVLKFNRLDPFRRSCVDAAQFHELPETICIPVEATLSGHYLASDGHRVGHIGKCWRVKDYSLRAARRAMTHRDS